MEDQTFQSSENQNNSSDPSPSSENPKGKNSSAKGQQKKKTSFWKWIVALWSLFILGILGFVLFFMGIANGLLGPLPTFVELESPKSSLASEVYSEDGVMMGKFYVEDRSNTDYEELPEHLIQALVSTEDERYYEHSGIDFRSLMRVLVRTVIGGQDAGGGSTLTQQLAKNIFHDVPKSKLGRVKQKLKEWVISVMLERSYTKEEIITMYLNTVSFSNNAFGIKAASRVYFNKEPNTLNVQESAVLVGMLKGSTKYNPIRNPELSRQRRNVVFQQMARSGAINQEEQDSLSRTDLTIDFKSQDHNEGLATYFREHLRSEIKEWAKTQTKLDGSTYDIYRDGLKIYTTINSKMQTYAEEAVATSMKDLQGQFDDHWKKGDPWDELLKINEINPKIKRSSIWYGMNEMMYRAIKGSGRFYNLTKHKKMDEEAVKATFSEEVPMSIFSWKGDIDTTMTPIDSIKYYKRILNTGFISLDPKTGKVKTWVGGIDHHHFKYDNVRPSSIRQVGSTFKPFVYTVAVQNGWSPCRKVPNVPVTFEDYDGWTPENSGDFLDGQWVTLKTGLAHSINRVTAYLMKQITPNPVVALVKRMGITSPVEPFPSICLGTPEVSVQEMVGAYTTFANKGIFSKPFFLERIEDKNGNIIQSFVPKQTEVLNEQTAYAMISLLTNVTDNGTGRRLRWKYNVSGEVAGKTGTTNENSDGWYIGMAPNLISGAWVGGDEKAIAFRTTRLGCGANMALPIVGEYLSRVYADETLGITQEDTFEKPKVLGFNLDCSKHFNSMEGDNPFAGSTSAPGLSNGTIPGVNSGPAPAKPDFDYNDQFD